MSNAAADELRQRATELHLTARRLEQLADAMEPPAAHEPGEPLEPAHEIAKRLGLKRNSVVKWCREEGWGELRDDGLWWTRESVIVARATR